MNLHVDNVRASARTGVVLERVPFTVFDGDVLELGNDHALPVVFGVACDWPLAGRAAELVKERLLDSGLMANHVRAKLARKPVVGCENLLLVKDCVSDGGVCCGGHIGVGERRVA